MSREVIFRTLANLTFFVHLVVIVILIGGVVGVTSGFYIEHPVLLRIHTAIVAVTAISQLLFLGCPLVTLENALRQQYAPETKYYGSFVVYLLLRFTGIKVPIVLITTITWFIVALTGIAWYVLYTK